MGVLIASCTANSNLEYKTPKRCVSPLRQRLAVVKWYRIDADWCLPQTRPHPPGGPENKTQPKARLSRDTFAMKVM